MTKSLRIRLAILALAVALGGPFAPSAAAEEPQDEQEAAVGRILPRLASDSSSEREKATAALLALGERALPAIRKAIEEAKDPEVQARLRSVFDRLEEGEIVRERERNLAAYVELKTALWKEHRDQWVVLAGGETISVAPSFEEAVAGAEQKTAGAVHRFVFHVGHEPPLKENPRGHGSLRAGDLGCAFDTRSITFAFVDDKTCIVGRDGRILPAPPVRVSAPAGEGPEASFEPFLNTGMPDGICVDPDTARHLGLARFELPGLVEGATLSPFARPGIPLDYPARRAWVNFRMPGVADGPARLQAIVPSKVEKK